MLLNETNVKQESKSSKIRELLTQGVKRAEIVKQLGVQYQFVMNVEKRMKAQIDKPEKVVEIVSDEHKEIYSVISSKSAQIRYLLNQGYLKTTIYKELGILYQFVRNVEEKMKERKEVNVDLLKNTINNCTQEQLKELGTYIKELKA